MEITAPEIIIPDYAGRSRSFQKAADWTFRSEEGLKRMIDHQKRKWQRFMRENAASADKEERKTVEGLGQLTAEIPLHFFLQWENAENGCWKDKNFLAEFKRDNPEVVVQRPTSNALRVNGLKAQ